MEVVLLYSLIAGVVGTGLGGLIGVFVGQKNNKLISAVISFAGGLMLAVVFFDLIPEAFNMFEDNMVVFLGLLWGILIMVIIDKIINRFSKSIDVKITALKNDKNSNVKGLKKAGIFLMLAIALHNIPEGLAIGSCGAVESSLGLTLAIIICLHDIPEGMAITLPLTVGKVKKWKSVALSILAGFMTVVGCFIGLIVGNINKLFSAFSLAFAGGAMLQVVMCEMIPDSINLKNDKSIFYYVLFGIIFGFVVNVFV